MPWRVATSGFHNTHARRFSAFSPYRGMHALCRNDMPIMHLWHILLYKLYYFPWAGCVTERPYRPNLKGIYRVILTSYTLIYSASSYLL